MASKAPRRRDAGKIPRKNVLLGAARRRGAPALKSGACVIALSRGSVLVSGRCCLRAARPRRPWIHDQAVVVDEAARIERAAAAAGQHGHVLLEVDRVLHAARSPTLWHGVPESGSTPRPTTCAVSEGPDARSGRTRDSGTMSPLSRREVPARRSRGGRSRTLDTGAPRRRPWPDAGATNRRALQRTLFDSLPLTVT
jgi:hypothetical protein